VCNVSYFYIFYYRLLCKVGVTCSVTCVYVFIHFQVRRPPPPWPAWSMLEKVGRIFSFQSFAQHWIGGEGGIYAINVSIIFCATAWRRCYCQLMEEYVWKHSLYPGGCSWDSVWGSGIFGYFHMEWWNFGEISLWWSGPEWTGLRDSELNPSNSNP
jgi:hypothetical protein